MFIELSAEQQALRDEVRAYFGGLLSEAEREALLTERHGTVYREVVRRMGRDGWLGVGWPQQYGGRGLGPGEPQIFVKEGAPGALPLPPGTPPNLGPHPQAHRTPR